jgi:hypothetical protein
LQKSCFEETMTQDWFAPFVEKLKDPVVQRTIAGSVVSGITLALTIWVARRLAGAPQLLVSLFGLLGRRFSDPETIAIDAYLATLESDSFEVRHPWMKEGQTLRDILIPVVSLSGQAVPGGEDLASLVRSALAANDPHARRIVMRGGPGAGKSVALRLVARIVRGASRPDGGSPRIPVLLSFAEYRDTGFDLAKAIAASLSKRGFRIPKQADSGGVEAFVAERLGRGDLFILIDALDELELSARKLAAKRLAAEMGGHAATHFVITCRSAAWRGQLKDVPHVDVEMAPFTPAAIRQFVDQWRFASPKSSAELLEVIQTQPHVGDLARNPLMLTIIAFLYSQPRYRLPENRAQFYEVCVRALLEEWDSAENPDRANQFDRPHKEHLLARLAHAHLSGPKPADDIPESLALQVFANGMESLGLKRGENTQMLEEIVVNSGLLVRLPPNGLRFPHQTFLEFFGAIHMLRQASAEAMLALYAADPRWREVLLLFCGLDEDIDQSSRTVEALLASADVETAMAAVSDARALHTETVSRVLDAVEESLETTLVTGQLNRLGSLSANRRSAHAARAKAILDHRLRRAGDGSVRGEALQALLLACLRRPTDETIGFVLDNLELLNLAEVLPEMGDRGHVLSAKVLGDADVTLAKKSEWIDGLRRAAAPRLLFEIMGTPTTEPGLRSEAAVALARMSRDPAFWHELDRIDFADPPWDDETERRLERWGWPFPLPATLAGRRRAWWLGLQLAEGHDTWAHASLTPWVEVVTPELSYLAIGLLKEARGRRAFPSGAPKVMELAGPRVMRSIWRKMGSEPWVKWLVWGVGQRGGLVFLTLMLLPGGLLFGWSAASGFSQLLGKGALAMPLAVAGTYLTLSLLAVSANVATSLKRWGKPSTAGVLVVPLLYGALGPWAFPYGLLTDDDWPPSLSRLQRARMGIVVLGVAASLYLTTAVLVEGVLALAIVAALIPMTWAAFSSGIPCSPVFPTHGTRDLARELIGAQDAKAAE